MDALFNNFKYNATRFGEATDKSLTWALKETRDIWCVAPVAHCTLDLIYAASRLSLYKNREVKWDEVENFLKGELV